ncbi:MAG TPA: tripartite tricarboxylate transporter substrate binding protein [Xanthobacteraceae bacterium]|nr:tripartite tricarboxylate transporter substrate binding protein [Xanthobacteraceae bacterium]
MSEGKTPRRRPVARIFAGIATFVAAVLLVNAPGNAQTYPDRPIKLIVPSAPGGPTDLPARLLSQVLPKLGQPVVIENRPGAGGAIGARFVAGSAPDGYTLLVGNTSVLAVIPAVSSGAGYDPAKQFSAVAKFSESYQILVVHPSVAAKTVRELIAYAKANPGKLNYAQTGAGGLPHLSGELFKSAAGVNIVGVPYKSGGDSITGLLGAQVDMTFENITVLLPLIREGRLRALAVTSRTRTPLAEDLPTMIEAGVPDYEVTTFNGIVAPAGTPEPIIRLLNATINEGLRAPDMQANLRSLGAVANPVSAAEFAAFIAAEARKWSMVANAANVHIN